MDWLPIGFDTPGWASNWADTTSPQIRLPGPPNTSFDPAYDIRDQPETGFYPDSQESPAINDEIMAIYQYFLMLIRTWLGMFGPGNDGQMANDGNFRPGGSAFPDDSNFPWQPNSEPSTFVTTDQHVPSGPGNSALLINDGAKPMHIKFTPNAGQQQIPDIVLQPGERRTIDFPPGWSGNWRSTAGGGDSYTLVEVAFDQFNGMTFYDVSFIEGSNMGATIEPKGGGRKTGTLKNLLIDAPPGLITYDAQGRPYGIKKSTISDIQDPAVIEYLSQHVPLGEGYKFPTDDASTAGTQDHRLIVHMQDFT
jgi:hypothetical protein